MQISPPLPKPEAKTKVAHVELQMEVLREIRKQLAPYHVAGTPITGDMVICDGTAVDSLTVMDMIVELEDRFDISIPLNDVPATRTVAQVVAQVAQLVGSDAGRPTA